MADPTLDGLLLKARQILKDAGHPGAAMAARKLASRLLGVGTAELISRGPDPLDPQTGEKLVAWAERLGGGEPLSRITGIAEFYGRDFIVTPDVLDPRPETELLVDTVKEFVIADRPVEKPVTLLDVGTGSGIIPVTLLAECQDLKAIGTDLSPACAGVAARNAKKHGVDERFLTVSGNLLSAFRKVPEIITANLPYIQSGVVPELDENVVRFDPLLALDGGPGNGFELYEQLFHQIAEMPEQPRLIALEIGWDQAETARNCFKNNGFGPVDILEDSSGHPRVVRWFRG